MNIDTLIAQLSILRDKLGGKAFVRLAVNQYWPIEHDIHGVAEVDGVACILDAGQVQYSDKKAWDNCVSFISGEQP